GNNIQLYSGSQPGEVVVHGVNTTVHGADQQVFEGVENLFADFGGGDDWLKADNLTLSAEDPGGGMPAFSTVFVDGNAGDDRIELLNTTIHAGGLIGGAIDVQIYGERMTAASAPTTGNDTIRLTGT